MPELALLSTLARSVEHVIETMCFYEAMATAPTPDWTSGTCAAVTFRGSRSGTLQLSVDSDAARSLTVQILGKAEMDTVSREQITGTVCELGKVICGHFLSSLDPSGRLVILPPRTIRTGPPKDSFCQWFSLPSGGLEVSIRFD